MSPRARTRLVVAGIAAAAAALVVGVTVVQSRGDDDDGGGASPAAAPTTTSPAADERVPLFAPDFGLPEELAGSSAEEQFEGLQARAERGDVEALLLLGAAYQRADQPGEARAAYDRALEVAPDDLRARVAAAVVRYDRDRPAAAFGRLGPLTRAHPRAAIVRYHLGLLLAFLGDGEEAQRQLNLAVRYQPRGYYGREAGRLLTRLEQS